MAKTRSRDQWALIGDRRSDTGTRRTHTAPRTSLIANRTVVFATCSFLSSIRAKDLLFSYLCRSSLYAGADIGQEEIPLRLARCADRRHRVAGRQGRPRSEAVLRGGQ